MKARKERVADIYDEIAEQCGYFPSVSRLAKHLKVDNAKVKKWMDGVPVIRDGHSIRYRARAVAERLADMEARG